MVFCLMSKCSEASCDDYLQQVCSERGDYNCTDTSAIEIQLQHFNIAQLVDDHFSLFRHTPFSEENAKNMVTEAVLDLIAQILKWRENNIEGFLKNSDDEKETDQIEMVFPAEQEQSESCDDSLLLLEKSDQKMNLIIPGNIFI